MNIQDMENKPLVNRVAQSGLITLNLEDHYPKGELAAFDLKEYLFKGLILREKEFRKVIKEHDWDQYRNKNLLVFCSTDAIIPLWAYMLVASHAAPFAAEVFQGNREEFIKYAILQSLKEIEVAEFEGKRLVIKGCGDKAVPAAAYLSVTKMLRPVAQSIMYGEPCSTVPVFKKPKQ